MDLTRSPSLAAEELDLNGVTYVGTGEHIYHADHGRTFAYEQAVVKATNQAKVFALDNTVVDAFDRAKVSAGDWANVYADDQTEIDAHDDAIIHVYSAAVQVRAFARSTVVLHHQVPMGHNLMLFDEATLVYGR